MRDNSVFLLLCGVMQHPHIPPAQTGQLVSSHWVGHLGGCWECDLLGLGLNTPVGLFPPC